MSIAGRREIGSLAAALVILAVIAFVVLYITVLGPKPPRVVAVPVALRRLRLTEVPKPTLTATLYLAVHVENPNYASVNYEATTALVYYHGSVAGRAPIPPGAVAARSEGDVGAVVDIFVERVAANGYFGHDVAAGFLNLSSFTVVRGKGDVAGIIKMEVLIHTMCETMVLLWEGAVTSSCSSTVDVSP